MAKLPKVVSHAITFTLGTLLSGSAVFAATNMVQAQKAATTVQYNGTTVSNPPGLVYGGSMYVQLYSIEQALKGAHMIPAWNGSLFSLTDDYTAGLSMGTTDNWTTELDLWYASAHLRQHDLDFAKADNDSSVSAAAEIQVLDVAINALQANLTAIQEDKPSDPALVPVINAWITAANAYINVYTEYKTALQTHSSATYTQANTDLDNASKLFDKYVQLINAYTLPGQTQPNAARFGGTHLFSNTAQSVHK